MASITRLNNSMSSIYGNRNVISGLASGMDTESMIENAISGYKLKISSLQQKQTKVTWQQQAMRGIIDKLVDFSKKYTSYASSTNLLSSSFFSSNSLITSQGANKDKVAATGKSGSTVQILGVKELATAATHSATIGSSGAIVLQGGKDMSAESTVSNLTGSLTIANGSSNSITIDLTEEDMKGVTDMAGLKDKINEKLKETDAGKYGIKAELDNGTIKLTGNNATYIKSASGKIVDTLGITPGESATSLSVAAGKDLTTTQTLADMVDGKQISVTLDGVTKTFTLSAKDKDGKPTTYYNMMDDLAKKVNTAFGKELLSKGTGKWTFAAGEGSTLSVSSQVGEEIGLASDNESSFLSMGKTLGELIKFDGMDRIAVTVADPNKLTDVKDENGNLIAKRDTNGNLVKEDGGKYYKVNEKGEALYALKVNGETVAEVNEHTTIGEVTTAINSSKAGVEVSYSKITNEFLFTSKEMGSQAKIQFEGLSEQLFGKCNENGKDAVFSMAVNGKIYDGITRSGNTFDVDGMKITLKGTFGEYTGKDTDANKLDALEALKDKTDAEKLTALGDQAVSFTSSANVDKIVDTIKQFAEEYNAMVKSIRDAYGTLPAQKSNGSPYEPLTSEEMEGMSETEIKNYEEKAKQGLLFGDRDLSNLYNELNQALSGNRALSKVGIEMAFSDGLSTVKIDEEKLRAALESDPSQVQEAFTGANNGGKTMMETMKSTLDRYGSVMGTKGILVERAGSERASSTLYTNAMQKMIDRYETQIDKWTDKMTDQVDRYTSQFSKLEQLIAQMNAQSSALGGLMGGY